ISIIPLGGFVKMYGDDPSASADIPLEERSRAFLHKPVIQRLAIVLAGPLMNLFFALFLFMMIGRVGEELPSPVVGDMKIPSAAAAAGFHTGDKILKIDGEPVLSWLDVQEKVEKGTGQALHFEIEREHNPASVTATPVSGPNENIFS